MMMEPGTPPTGAGEELSIHSTTEETLEDDLICAVDDVVIIAYKLRQKSEALAADNSALETKLQTTQKRIMDLRSQIKEAQKESKTLKAKNQKLGQEAIAFQKSIGDLSEQVKEEKRQRFQLTQRISQLLKGDFDSNGHVGEEGSANPRLRIALVSGKDFSEQNQRNLSTFMKNFPNASWELIEVPCDKRGLHDFDFIAYNTGLVRNHKYGFWVIKEARKAGIVVVKGRTPQKIEIALASHLREAPGNSNK